MSDVTEAPTQDAIAESLLGDETEQQQTVEQPETEQQAEVEQVESQDVEQVEQEQVEEQADDWLPTEQEKVFPDEVLSRYAERYGLKEHDLANPQIRQLVHDKINSDILIQQQREQEQFVEEQPEPQREEPTPAAQPQVVTREQYFQNLERVINDRTDPEIAKSFHKDFIGVWSKPEAEQPMAFAQVASKYMLNLVSTFLPDMLQAQMRPIIGGLYPGFDKMFDAAARTTAWETVRESDPLYQSLPAFNTPEFRQMADEIGEKYPAIADWGFQLSREGKLHGEAAQKLYTTLAQIAAGQRPDPQLMQRAAAAGAKNARRAEVRRSAGNLGSGQSKAATGQRGSSQFQTNDDIFDAETMARYKQEHGRL